MIKGIRTVIPHAYHAAILLFDTAEIRHMTGQVDLPVLWKRADLIAAVAPQINAQLPQGAWRFLDESDPLKLGAEVCGEYEKEQSHGA